MSPTYPRVVDLLSPLSLQRRLDSDLELAYCDVQVSVELNKVAPPRVTRTRLGGTIERDRTNTMKTRIRYGNDSVDSIRSANPNTQKEIFDDVLTLGVPDAVVCRRITREAPPRKLQNHKLLQSSNYIFRQDTKKSNYTNMVRGRWLDFPVANPFNIIMSDLANNGIGVTKAQKLRMRSELLTDFVITDQQGHKALQPIIAQLQASMCNMKFWEDIASPVVSSAARFDGQSGHIMAYYLNSHRRYVAI